MIDFTALLVPGMAIGVAVCEQLAQREAYHQACVAELQFLIEEAAEALVAADLAVAAYRRAAATADATAEALSSAYELRQAAQAYYCQVYGPEGV